MPIYNISFAQAHAGGAFLTQPAVQAQEPARLTPFEREEVNLYLAEWSRSGGEAAVADRVRAAIGRLDNAQAVKVNADGPLPDLSPWMIDVKRADTHDVQVSRIMLRQLAHWRAAGKDRDDACQAIMRKLELGITEFTVRYEGELPDFSAWGIVIRGVQAVPAKTGSALHARAVESVQALAPRTLTDIRELIRDMPQAALWTGSPAAWTARCMQVFARVTDAIDKLDATTDVKLDLLRTLDDTLGDRAWKYAGQDERVLRETNHLMQEIQPVHWRFRERLQAYRCLNDWRAGHPQREVAYQKILRALSLNATQVTVQCDGEPPNLLRSLGIVVRRHVPEVKSQAVDAAGEVA